MTMTFNAWYIHVLSMFNGIETGCAYIPQERGDKWSITQLQFSTDLEKLGLPLLYLKRTPWRLAIKEMLWFCSDSYDYADLHNAGCTWWEPWLRSVAPPGFKWPCDSPDFSQIPGIAEIEYFPVSDLTLPYKRHHAAFKRIARSLVDGDFDSTRLYCSLWPSEEDLHKAALPPCALAYQVTVEHGRLNMSVTQRSADLLCGVPTNVIQYAFLTHLYASMAGLRVGVLEFNFGDLHVYKAHAEQQEWQDLLAEDRAKNSEELCRCGSEKFDTLLSMYERGSVPELDVSDANLLRLPYYATCGKLTFPVVPVHTSK